MKALTASFCLIVSIYILRYMHQLDTWPSFFAGMGFLWIMLAGAIQNIVLLFAKARKDGAM